MSEQAHSAGTLRELSRQRVLDALRMLGSASRTDLARATGLSRTTVTSVVADLQARGLVVEGRAEADGGRGRPPLLLRLDPSAGAAVGVDFGHAHVRVAVADLSATVLAEHTVALDVDHSSTAALDTAAELAEELLEDAGVDRCRVLGAAMGLPGPIDRRTGTVGSRAILPDWVGMRPADELARRLELHVQVDNDANLGALAEVSFGAGRGLGDVVYVKLASGIGAGLVLGGRIHRGTTGVAGELGHVQVRPDGVVCRCGSRGCLETVASAGALLGLLRPVHGPELGPADLLELVAAGDPGACRVAYDAGLAIGRALADLCNYVNPAAVVIGGDLSLAGAPLLTGVRQSIDRYAQPVVADAVTVVAGQLGERAEVLGALALVVGDSERLRSAGLAALPPTPSDSLVGALS
jgi:predicted NBD/HSP70 family sugar kinase/biotin operon repressor